MTDTTENGSKVARLRSLAEFRYQMRKFLSFSEMASERVGIGAQQYQLMQVIAAMPEGQKASITYLAERMILRHNSTVDLRRSLVKLTKEGETVLWRLVAEHLGELAPRAEALIESLRVLQDHTGEQGAATL